MQITLNTFESGPDELTALIALCASLGGRLPSTTDKPRDCGHDHIPNAETAAVLRELSEREDLPESERLIEQAAAANTAPPPPATDSAVDSKGTPWDARIHSESHATVADGSWRKRRGVDEATFASVMAELSDAPPPPPVEQSVPNAPPAPTADVPPAPEPAASAPVATDTPPPPPAAAGAFDGFPAFVSAVSKHNKNYAELNELAGMVGVTAFKDMKDHADKWDTFFAMLG